MDQLSKRPIEFVQKTSFLSASLKNPPSFAQSVDSENHQHVDQTSFGISSPSSSLSYNPSVSSSLPINSSSTNVTLASSQSFHQQPSFHFLTTTTTTAAATTTTTTTTSPMTLATSSEMIVENANTTSFPKTSANHFKSAVDIPSRRSERIVASPKPYKKKKSISMSCDREDDFLRTTIDRRNMSDPKEYINRRGRRNAITSLLEPRSTPAPSYLSRSPSDWSLVKRSEETYHGNNNTSTSTPLGTSVEEVKIDPVFQMKIDECEVLFGGVKFEKE